MSIEIAFAMFPRELAPNSRFHFRAKARAVARYRHECEIGARLVKKGAFTQTFPMTTPVTAYTTFYFKVERARDTDNLSASIKALWDGCRDAGVLAADDSKSLHHAPVSVVVDKTLKAPEIRVRLESAE